ncbi:MAG: hypothetical protein QW087_02510 [Methanomassiliicoccales archaeon]
MKAAILFDLDELQFIEPDFETLTDDRYTLKLLEIEARTARLLINENEWPIAVAFETAQGWIAGNFIYRRINAELLDKLENMDIEIYQERQAEWETAVREYYSLKLMRNVVPALDDFSQERADNLLRVIDDLWHNVVDRNCFDAACGTGIGSYVVRMYGMSVISFDKDPSLLVCGMRTGRLLPECTMCIDASEASKFVKKAPFGLLLMAGEITQFNALQWRRIVSEVLELANDTIITTGTKTEATMIRQWSLEKGRSVEMIEDESSNFYDRWICHVKE